jgi:hypothetical protein
MAKPRRTAGQRSGRGPPVADGDCHEHVAAGVVRAAVHVGAERDAAWPAREEARVVMKTITIKITPAIEAAATQAGQSVEVWSAKLLENAATKAPQRAGAQPRDTFARGVRRP